MGYNKTMITKQSVHAMRADIEKALESVGAKYNVQFDLGNCRFSANNARFQLNFASINEAGIAETKERTDFKTLASLHGLDPNLLDSTVQISGDSYKIVGLKKRCYARPILVEKVKNNRVYKIDVATLKNYL